MSEELKKPEAPKSRAEIVAGMTAKIIANVSGKLNNRKPGEELVVPLSLEKVFVNESELGDIYWAIHAAVNALDAADGRIVVNMDINVKRESQKSLLEHHEITNDAQEIVAEEVAETHSATAAVLDDDAINALLNDVTPGDVPVDVKPVVFEAKTTDTGPRQALTNTPSGEQRPVKGIEFRAKKPGEKKEKKPRRWLQSIRGPAKD